MSREDTFDIMTGSITVDDYQRKLEHEFERRGLPPQAAQMSLMGLDMLRTILQSPEYQEEVSTVFKRFDTNSDNVLDHSEVFHCICELNKSTQKELKKIGIKQTLPDPTQEIVKDIIRTADFNRDGVLQLDEFMTVYDRFSVRNFFAGALGEIQKY